MVKEEKVKQKEEVTDYKKLLATVKKDNDKLVNNNRKKSLYVFGALFVTLITVGFAVFVKTDFVVEESNIIGWLAFSIVTNILILMLTFGTGVGQGLVASLKERMMFGSGRYVKTLMISKSGPIREHFKKIDSETSSFKINGKTYTLSPNLLHYFKKIPTYVHTEGDGAPLDIFSIDKEGMSSSEIDQVMNSKASFDFKQWLTDKGLILVIAVLIIIGAVTAAAFASFSSMSMLQEGVSCLASNIPAETIAPIL